jgi:hypothetical protein
MTSCARRHQLRAAVANCLRGRPVRSGRLVPFDEIVGSLGWRGQRQLGPQAIRLDTIVGTVGRRRGFGRCFRPTSCRVRYRWERLALARRRGEAIPPIKAYRVGHRQFVNNGYALPVTVRSKAAAVHWSFPEPARSWVPQPPAPPGPACAASWTTSPPAPSPAPPAASGSAPRSPPPRPASSPSSRSTRPRRSASSPPQAPDQHEHPA